MHCFIFFDFVERPALLLFLLLGAPFFFFRLLRASLMLWQGLQLTLVDARNLYRATGSIPCGSKCTMVVQTQVHHFFFYTYIMRYCIHIRWQRVSCTLRSKKCTLYIWNGISLNRQRSSSPIVWWTEWRQRQKMTWRCTFFSPSWFCSLPFFLFDFREWTHLVQPQNVIIPMHACKTRWHILCSNAMKMHIIS